MLKLAPGREEEAGYWLAALSVNRAIMSALEATEPMCPARRNERRSDSPDGRETARG